MVPEWLFTGYDRHDNPQRYVTLAQELLSQGERRAAATAYDRAFGIAPTDRAIARVRDELLNQLAVIEHGIVFRYIPAGTFLMGSEAGDPDEAPIHPVQLHDFWLAETPISWATHCTLMGWEPPPRGLPTNYAELWQAASQGNRGDWLFRLFAMNQMRLQYCEDETLRAQDWHAHNPEQIWTRGENEQVGTREIFSDISRERPELPFSYKEKPVVAVDWEEAVGVGARLSDETYTYRLPTEAEWEKAARGGLIGATYPWGELPPSPEQCDFDRFEQFSIRRVRSYPPNGYGLYAMSGSVWEWTSDWYDGRYYQDYPTRNPHGSDSGEERVLRGGSWADCADALRVSFRMSSHIAAAPTIGFRLCRVERQGNDIR